MERPKIDAIMAHCISPMVEGTKLSKECMSACEYIIGLEAQLAQAKADNAKLIEASSDLSKALETDGAWWDSVERMVLNAALAHPHPGADLLRELEQYKASDASKEQYIAEVYSRAREAERELAEYKKALELATDPKKNVCAKMIAHGQCKYPEVECIDCILAQAKEALSDDPDKV